MDYFDEIIGEFWKEFFSKITPWIWNLKKCILWKMVWKIEPFSIWNVLNQKILHTKNSGRCPTYEKSHVKFSILAFQRSGALLLLLFVIFMPENLICSNRKFLKKFNLSITKNRRNKGILVWKSWTWYFTTGWLFVWPYVFVS